MRSLEHHTDWVNDIVLCMDGRNSEWRVRNLYVLVCIFSETLEATKVLNKKRNRNENVIIGHTHKCKGEGRRERDTKRVWKGLLSTKA